MCIFIVALNTIYFQIPLEKFIITSWLDRFVTWILPEPTLYRNSLFDTVIIRKSLVTIVLVFGAIEIVLKKVFLKSFSLRTFGLIIGRYFVLIWFFMEYFRNSIENSDAYMKPDYLYVFLTFILYCFFGRKEKKLKREFVKI
jgi:hypothetical protein